MTPSARGIVEMARFSQKGMPRTAKGPDWAVREAARADSKSQYGSVSPCKGCNTSVRWTANASCVTCIRARQRSYQRVRDTEERARAQRKYLSKEDKRMQHRVCVVRRRAIAKGAIGTHTKEQILALLLKQGRKCANCHVIIATTYTVDHITPLARGGSNAIYNIQLLCKSCNSQKSARDPIEYAQRQLGRLL